MKKDPIRRIKLSHKVRDRLLDMINRNELAEGDLMPSEHDLMDRFQVGRPAVREAMQSLENMGLIEIRHGGRARVRQVTATDVLNQIDSATRHLLSSSVENVEHLREARQVFEAGVAIMAVERATDEDIRELKRRLDRMGESRRDRTRFLQSDIDFHETIARISGNPILLAVSSAMLKWLAQTHTDYQKDILGIPELEDLTYEEHQKIYHCIAQRDGLGAAREIRNHILRVNRSYHEYQGKA